MYDADHLSKRKIAKRLGVHRDTVSAAIAAEQPPEYKRELRGSKFDPYKPKIQVLLQEILEGEGYLGKD